MDVSLTFNMGDLTPYLEVVDDGDGNDLRENLNQEGKDEANSMSISIKKSTQVLLSTQKLHHKGLGSCTNLKFQFKVRPNP